MNRRPPIRYSDGTLGRRCRTVDGGNKDESDSEESNKSDSNTGQTSVGARDGEFGGSEGSRAGNRSPIQQTSSPPSSPFHGFVGHRAPVGPDVLGGGFVHSLASSVNTRLPPRRLGWIINQQRPKCPAFSQACRGGHVHKGMTRLGVRRQSVPALPISHQAEFAPLLPAQSLQRWLRRAPYPVEQTADTSSSQQPTVEGQYEAGQGQHGHAEVRVAASEQEEGGEEVLVQDLSQDELNLFLTPTQMRKVLSPLPVPPPPPPSVYPHLNLVFVPPPPPPFHFPPPPPILVTPPPQRVDEDMLETDILPVSLFLHRFP